MLIVFVKWRLFIHGQKVTHPSMKSIAHKTTEEAIGELLRSNTPWSAIR
jgi:hypothetical protein